MKNQSKNVVLAAILATMVSACDTASTKTPDAPKTAFSVAAMSVIQAKPTLKTEAAVKVANLFTFADLQTSTSGTLADALAAMKPKAGTPADDAQGQLDQIRLVVTPETALTFKDATVLSDFAKSAVVLNAKVAAAAATATTPEVKETYADSMAIDHTVAAQEGKFTPRVLVLGGGNALTIKGAPKVATDVDSIGTFLTAGAANTVTLTDGAKVQLDSGRLVGTTISAADTSAITFGAFADAAKIFGGDKLVTRQFFVGDASIIESVAPLEISAGQTVTLDDLDSAGKDVAASVGGTIKAPLTVDGKLVIAKGKTEGALIIGKDATAAGEVQLASGSITGTVLVNAKGVFKMTDAASSTVMTALAAKTVATDVQVEANKFALTSTVTDTITNTGGTATLSGGTVAKVVNTGKFTMSDDVYAAAVKRINDVAVTSTPVEKTTAIGLLAWTSKAGEIENNAGGEYTLTGGKVGTVANAGKFTMSGGEAGDFANHDGGTFTFDSTANATMGAFTTTAFVPAAGVTAKGNTINLATGKTLTLTSMAVDANTTINLALNVAGASQAAGADAVANPAVNPIAVLSVPTLDLSAVKAINLLSRNNAILAKGTKFILSQGVAGGVAAAVDTAKLTFAGLKQFDGTTAIAAADVAFAVDAATNTISLTLVNGLAKGATAAATDLFPKLGRFGIVHKGSNSAKGMVGLVSSDMNAVVSDINGFSITTSADQTNNSNFVGMSFSATSAAKLGAYVGYTSVAGLSDAKVSEFGMFASTKFAGFNVLNSIAYGANENQMVDGAMKFNVDTNSLVAQSKTSYAFDASGFTFAPNFVLGMGQLMSQNNSMKMNPVDTLSFSADSTAAFAGFGFDAVSNFKVSTMSVQAFASFSVSSEFGSRQLSVSNGETAAINGTETSLMLGGKVAIDSNSSFYATTEVSKVGDADVNSKTVAGLNFKI